MTRYVVYGAGSPVIVDALSPEHAEALVVEAYGVPIEMLVTVRCVDLTHDLLR